MHTIYLDHNATTPLLPEAWDAMRPLMTETFGNPSSAHATGRKARQALEDARETIARLLGAFPDEVTFTSGATEANNIAIFGYRSSRILASHLEHPCVIEPLRQLEKRGVSVEWLPVNAHGFIAEIGNPGPDTLVCLMLANHETGAVQPVRNFALALPPGAKLHCDAVQAVGKIPVDFREPGATTLTASAHKFGGPKGVGVLLTKRETNLQPLTFGGHQQKGRRPGTEPVALAVGMAMALEVAVRNMETNRTKLEAIRERFWTGLQRDCSPVVLNGPENEKSLEDTHTGIIQQHSPVNVLPTTLNVSFPGCRADLLLMSLDLSGIACSTGSACSSGSLLPSPILRAMNVPDEILRSALRFSFAPTQSLDEIDDAVCRITECVNRLRRG